MMGGDFGWGGGWMLVGSFMMLLFWGGLIALIVLAIRALAGGNTTNRNNETTMQHRYDAQSPMEILQSRYATGEISREDYETMRRDLQAV